MWAGNCRSHLATLMLRVALSGKSTLRVLRWGSPPNSCWLSAVRRTCAGGPGGPGPSRAQVSCWATRPCSKQADHTLPVQPWTRSFHDSAVRLKKRQPPEPPPRELDLLRYDMKHLWESPKPALYLTLAGLLPFVGPPLLMAVTETYLPELAYAQVAYGASVISFLGGARWGFALPESSPAKPDWINLANGAVPPLLACVAMLLSASSVAPAAAVVIVGLGVSLHYDLSLLPSYPSWLKALRAAATLLAFLALLATLVLDGLFPEKTYFT
ncbi:Transmembrane protein 69 [Merluccius polli]|uniref:Transmembrane protein 69 n=1 Tax=Merluccius polli TaxID=89951 RepID=A0AA47MXP4_MERPO|nr:Transmembrane protein 69 [Merluccius polli]